MMPSTICILLSINPCVLCSLFISSKVFPLVSTVVIWVFACPWILQSSSLPHLHQLWFLSSVLTVIWLGLNEHWVENPHMKLFSVVWITSFRKTEERLFQVSGWLISLCSNSTETNIYSSGKQRTPNVKLWRQNMQLRNCFSGNFWTFLAEFRSGCAWLFVWAIHTWRGT